MMVDSYMEKKQLERRLRDELIEFYRLRSYGIERFLREKAEEFKTRYEFTFLADSCSDPYLVKLINSYSSPSKEEAKRVLKRLNEQKKELIRKETEALFGKGFFSAPLPFIKEVKNVKGQV